MGECQSHPTKQPELILSKQSQVKPQVRQSKKYQKDAPSSDFAIPINQIPRLTTQAQNRLKQLGPFNYQNCGKYNQGAELGPYQLKNGYVYVGEWMNGKTNGKGKYYLPDHSLFEGISVQNQIEGFGRIIHANGDYFQGQVKQSKANGQGMYVEGQITYKGSFKDNLQHGQGLEYSNLYEFKGYYKQGNKEKGMLILKNKQKYEYNGQFKNNKYDGRGVLINDVGKYEGQFFNGQKNGYGKFTWADGSFFEGDYKNDQKDGEGKLYNKKGTLIREGIWEHNNIIN